MHVEATPVCCKERKPKATGIWAMKKQREESLGTKQTKEVENMTKGEYEVCGGDDATTTRQGS